MNKLPLHTTDLTESNYKALASLFPNAVTETINENDEVVRAIDADVLKQLQETYLNRVKMIYNDATLVNFEQIFKTYSPETKRKVL